jgi:hypothetical protein
VIEKLYAEGFEPLGDKWIFLLVVCAADYTTITASHQCTRVALGARLGENPQIIHCGRRSRG